MEMKSALAAPTPRRTIDWRMRRGIVWRVLGKIMVLVGVMATASFACLFALGVLSMHVVVTDDGQVLYCDQVGMSFADDFDDQGRWLKGWHEYTCDGRTVRTDEFTDESADLGLP
jgi:hypothetical protein